MSKLKKILEEINNIDIIDIDKDLNVSAKDPLIDCDGCFNNEDYSAMDIIENYNKVISILLKEIDKNEDK